MVQVICVISRSGTRRCNLSTTVVGDNQDKICEVLAEKARAWIAEYLSRGAGGGADAPGENG